MSAADVIFSTGVRSMLSYYSRTHSGQILGKGEIFDLHFQMGHEILRDLLEAVLEDTFRVVSLAVKVGERSYLLLVQRCPRTAA